MGFIFFKPQLDRTLLKLSSARRIYKRLKNDFSHFTPFIIMVICVQLLLANQASAISSFFTDTDWSSGDYASSSLNTDLSSGQVLLDSNYEQMSSLFDPTTQDNISSLAVLNNKLYLGACQNIYGDTFGAIYSYDYATDHSQLEYTTTDYGLQQLSVINNQVMVPGADSGAGVNTDESLYLFNGTSWQKKQNIHNALHTDGLVVSYDNKLYAQSYNGSQHNRIQSSSDNGDTWIDVRVQNSSQYWHKLLGEYNGQLWLSCLNEANTSQVGIESYNGSTWNFHQVSQLGNVYIVMRMATFNGKAYLGCDSKANVSSLYSMDSSGNISAIAPFSFPVRTITQGLCVYDGKLFVSGIKDPSGTPSAFLCYTEDGTTWTTVSSTLPATTYLRGGYVDREQMVHPLAGYAGRLFMGTTDSAKVYVADVETTGELVSAEHEISEFNRLQLTWNANTPASTSIKFQIRCADSSGDLSSATFVGPDGTSGTYFDTSGESVSGLATSSYVQYKLYMSTSDARYTPYLNDVTVTGALDIVDDDPPTTTISTSPATPNGDNGWFKTAVSVTLSSSEAGTTYYQWDSTAGAWTTYSASFSGLSGNHTLYYYSRDSENNTETTKSQVIKIDTTAPAAFTLSSPSTGTWQSIQKPTLSWNASSDGVSGISSYIVEVDGATDKTVSSATTSTQVTNNMSEGSHSWQITVKDAAGNQTSTSSRVVNIDLSDPTASISSPASGATVGGTVTIAGTATDSNFSSYVLEYGMGASPTTWTQISSSNSSVSGSTLGTLDTASLADGSYTIKLTATDQASKSTTSSLGVNISNTVEIPADDGSGDDSGGGGSGGGSGGGTPVNEPQTTQLKINAGEGLTNGDRVKLSFLLAADPIAVMLSNDGISWSQPQQYEDTKMWNLSPDDGEKTVYAKFHITVNNWSEPIKANIVLDSTPPSLTITAEEVYAAAAKAAAESKRFAVKANASDDHGIEKIEFYLNDRITETDAEPPFEYLLSVNSNSNSTIKVIAYDRAGNKSTSAKSLSSSNSEIFKDIPADFWATLYIDELNQKGVIGGFADGSFRPDDNISRAEFAKMIVKAMKWSLIAPDKPSFSDIPKDHWCYSYIETAKAHGVIDGYRNGEFRSDKSITRAEISKMATSAAKLDLGNTEASFKDVPESFWAYSYIATAKSHDIVSGYKDGAFRPESKATRAEAAKMIYALTNS